MVSWTSFRDRTLLVFTRRDSTRIGRPCRLASTGVCKWGWVCVWVGGWVSNGVYSAPASQVLHLLHGTSPQTLRRFGTWPSPSNANAHTYHCPTPQALSTGSRRWPHCSKSPSFHVFHHRFHPSTRLPHCHVLYVPAHPPLPNPFASAWQGLVR